MGVGTAAGELAGRNRNCVSRARLEGSLEAPSIHFPPKFYFNFSSLTLTFHPPKPPRGAHPKHTPQKNKNPQTPHTPGRDAASPRPSGCDSAPDPISSPLFPVKVSPHTRTPQRQPFRDRTPPGPESGGEGGGEGERGRGAARGAWSPANKELAAPYGGRTCRPRPHSTHG